MQKKGYVLEQKANKANFIFLKNSLKLRLQALFLLAAYGRRFKIL